MECSSLVLVMSPRTKEQTAGEGESTMKEYIVSADIRTQEMMGLLSKYEIVRCKDCKWLKQRDEECGGRYWCKRMSFETKPDGFCAWGERKVES